MRKILLFTMLAFTTYYVDAMQLSPQEALLRASVAKSGPAFKQGKGEKAFEESPVYTASKNGNNQLYVFNRLNGNSTTGNGFVIVSADDCGAPILGYSDSGAFDADNMPENFMWWLSQYADQIAAYSSVEAVASTVNYAPAARTDVAPLLETQWAQRSPFNDQCPEISGQRAVAGCVATAMAQVMYYHKWPQEAVANPIGSDPATITFDWSNMLPKYTSTSPQESKDAVALLVRVCGASVNMNYGVSESDAKPENMLGALRKFGYDKGMRYLPRDLFSDEEWDDIIYEEVKNNRPVLYGGISDENKGHRFVCDGYSGGYYHMNWGWGGMSDGYFLLNALDPEYQSTGGSNSGFNHSQNALVGIQRPQADSKLGLVFYNYGILTAEKEMNNDYNFTSFDLDLNTSSFYNNACENFSAYIGVRFSDNDGNSYNFWDYYEINRGSTTNFMTIEINGTLLPDNTYVVTPVFKTTDNSVEGDMFCPNLSKYPLVATVKSGKISFAVKSPLYSSVNALTYDMLACISSSTPANVVGLESSGWEANLIELVDAEPFANSMDFKAETVSYTRNFAHQNWSALYLPYALSGTDWADYASDVIKYTGDTQIGGETVLTFERVNAGASLEANHPYLFKPKKTGEVVLTVQNKTVYSTPQNDYCADSGSDYDLYGTYVGKVDMSTSGAYALKDGDFHPANSDAAVLKPFRAYLLPAGASQKPAVLRILVDGDVDGVHSVISDEKADNVLYDMSGRVVLHPTSGLYILNGHKIYIK